MRCSTLWTSWKRCCWWTKMGKWHALKWWSIHFSLFSSTDSSQHINSKNLTVHVEEPNVIQKPSLQEESVASEAMTPPEETVFTCPEIVSKSWWMKMTKQHSSGLVRRISTVLTVSLVSVVLIKLTLCFFVVFRGHSGDQLCPDDLWNDQKSFFFLNYLHLLWYFSVFIVFAK